MATLHVFSEGEARAIAKRMAELQGALRVIAEIHGIAEPYTLSPDGTSLVRPSESQLSAAQTA